MSLPEVLGIPVDDDGPVFAEPWQAQAFAMAVRLFEQGHFTWSEWAEELSRQIAADPEAEYYRQWLAALEVMTTRTGLASEDELAERRQAWADAASRTPHGQPIYLT